MSEVTVTPSSPEHLSEIASIEKECFSDPWDEKEISFALENPASRCFSAIHEGKIIGYGFIYVVADESEVLNVAVTKTHRRRGIGLALMEEMIRTAKDAGGATMYLEVRESNIPAKNMYSSLGFEKIGTRKNYYRNPTEDAHIMAKTL